MRERLKRLWALWGHVDDLRGLIEFLRWAVLSLVWGGAVTGIIFSAAALAAGWLSTFWFVAVTVAAVIIAVVAPFLLRRNQPDYVNATINEIVRRLSDSDPSASDPQIAGPAIDVTAIKDENFALLKVRNNGPREAEFEARIEQLDGTGVKETPYHARWREHRQASRPLKAGEYDFINVAECVRSPGRVKAILRFYTADIPAGESTSHVFEREIPFGYEVICQIIISAEPPLPAPCVRWGHLETSREGGLAHFYITERAPQRTGPPMLRE